MRTISSALRKKLDDLPDDVRQLAAEAVLQAERLPETTLAAHLEGMLRVLAKKNTLPEGVGRGGLPQ